MDRTQAINICKEIQSRIPEIAPQGIAIMCSQHNNSLSIGYTINLTGIGKEHMGQIKQLIKDHSLEVNEGDNCLIIYTPRILKEEV